MIEHADPAFSAELDAYRLSGRCAAYVGGARCEREWGYGAGRFFCKQHADMESCDLKCGKCDNVIDAEWEFCAWCGVPTGSAP